MYMSEKGLKETDFYVVPFTFYPEQINNEEMGPEWELMAVIEASSEEEVQKIIDTVSTEAVKNILDATLRIPYGKALRIIKTGENKIHAVDRIS
jgi:hypothetical protein